MLATKFVQALAISSKSPLGAIPAVHARALFATKVDPKDRPSTPKNAAGATSKNAEKGSPAGEQGRDIRDTGTGKVNVPPGQPTKKADAPDAKFGGKAPGMTGAEQQRGQDEATGGSKTGKASAQQPGSATNYQQKRGFSFSASAFAVSDTAKQNINPKPSSSSSSGSSYKNLEFYPEKPGMTLDPRAEKKDDQQNQQQQQRGDQQKGESYKPQHNPSQTGKKADSKYMDEAMAGKSGPVSGGEEGRRRFSTSAAAFAVPKNGDGNAKDSGKDPMMNTMLGGTSAGSNATQSSKRDGVKVEGGYPNPETVGKSGPKRGETPSDDDFTQTKQHHTSGGGTGQGPKID